MDATVFDHRIPIDRTRLVAQTGTWTYFDLEWGTHASEQIIRAAGFAGSVVVDLRRQNEVLYRAVAKEVKLPYGVFGSVLPPAIWAMPQYGSVVIYKQFLDRAHKYIQYTPPVDKVGEVFHTWIENLSCSNATVGGTAYSQWTFRIMHEFTGRFYWLGHSTPMQHSWNPQQYSNPGPMDQQVPKKILLHWYALGMDPNLVGQ